MFSFRSQLLGILTAGVGVLASPAVAGPGYSVVGFATAGANIPKIQAAWERLGNAPVLKGRTSRSLLMANIADGDNPATLSFVVIYPSLASSEATRAKLFADPAWTEWQETLAGLGTQAGSTRYRTLRSFGDISDADVVWENYAFRVTNVPGFIAANERFLATAAGKTFPGQSHIVAVAAGGVGPATHLLDVGWASEAEMEGWQDRVAANAEYMAYLADLEDSAEFLGNVISRTLSAGGATLKSTLGR